MPQAGRGSINRKMKISFLTTNDPLYLPDFFEKVLATYGKETECVFVVPPLYRKQSSLQAALRYAKTFGWGSAGHLCWRLLAARIKGRSIQNVCRKQKVKCQTLQNVNDSRFLKGQESERPDLFISVSCPQIFKKRLIGLPALGILNIHGAILPQYRGVMPSFWMLANGETKAGVSIYFVNEKIDAGDLCGQRIFEIDKGDTLDTFIRRSKSIAAELLAEVLDQIKNGKIARTPLNLGEGSYYSWPDANAVKKFRETGRKFW